MGAAAVLITMLVVIVMTWAVARFGDAHAAYLLFERSQHLFGPEPQTVRSPTKRRPYLSAVTKKEVAAKQSWRCAACGKLLDSTFEIDHVVPLFRGGGNGASNLQALHRACHMAKSALDARMRG